MPFSRLQPPPAWPDSSRLTSFAVGLHPLSWNWTGRVAYCLSKFRFILGWHRLCLSDTKFIVNWQYLSARAPDVPKDQAHLQVWPRCRTRPTYAAVLTSTHSTLPHQIDLQKRIILLQMVSFFSHQTNNEFTALKDFSIFEEKNTFKFYSINFSNNTSPFFLLKSLSPKCVRGAFSSLI